jgi:PIN domain nuclease of toxin-antitoxin system
MRLLLDTHVVLKILRDDLETAWPRAAQLMRDDGHSLHVSVATIWEIAIKQRIGKLECPVPVEHLDTYLTMSGFAVVPITAAHAKAVIAPDLALRDPFDRLLLAVAQVEAMRLVTADRALAEHPLTLPA